MQEAETEIKYVHDFVSQDEYLVYVSTMASTRRDEFERYLNHLSHNSLHLLNVSEKDVRLHIFINYMLGVCKMVEYSSRTMH